MTLRLREGAGRAIARGVTMAIVGLVVVAIGPMAFAVPPADTQNFLPDDTPAGSVNGDQLSDKFDGTDNAAHLTNVSTPDTASVTWYACPSARFDQNPGPGTDVVTDDDQLQGCTFIGTSTTARRPATGVADDPATTTVNESLADEAYEFFWNIPLGLDNTTSDIVALACTTTGPGTVEGGASATCTSDVENNVFLDDADQGIQADQTSTAEITTICTGRRAGEAEETGHQECQLEDDTTTPPDPGTDPDPDPAVEARFRNFEHGDNLPPGGIGQGVVFRATSSIDVTALNGYLTFGDATTDPGGTGAPGTASTSCVQIGQTGNARSWQCTITDYGPNATGDEFSLSVYDFGGGAGDCDDEFCILDAHYVVTAARAVDQVRLTFNEDGPDAGSDPECATVVGTETNSLDADGAEVLGCLIDQFGQPGPAGVQVSFETNEAAEIVDCGPGDNPASNTGMEAAPAASGASDLDPDVQRCTTTTDGEGEANAFTVRDEDASFPGENQPGSAVITFCVDSDVTPDGCADEPANRRATTTKTYVTGAPAIVDIAFDDEGLTCNPEGSGGGANPGDDPDRSNQVGERDALTVCTFDQFGNFAPTNVPNGGRIFVTIEPRTGAVTATRFVSTPPQETSGFDAKAQPTIEAVREGADFIEVVLSNEAGVEQDRDFVDKTVFAAPAPPPGDTVAPNTSITGLPKNLIRTKKRRVQVAYSFTGTDNVAIARFECSLDGGPFTTCTSPRLYRVGRGTHTFAVRAVDTSGNVDASPATDSFKVKKKKPRRR